MSNVVKIIMIRVIRNRMASGDAIEDIFASYPKLTEEERKELREAVE